MLRGRRLSRARPSIRVVKFTSCTKLWRRLAEANYSIAGGLAPAAAAVLLRVRVYFLNHEASRPRLAAQLLHLADEVADGGADCEHLREDLFDDLVVHRRGRRGGLGLIRSDR